ncbi:hypothetical protein XENTR_v10021633 [Xenopus tropicalis]|uniref:Thyroxine-binding globulin n=1 Tax=Xenopus tropicalis TaxID=8364 RepID=Q5M8K2_XENTR|eukprot:XP_012823754.1 PREDICTED: serine proteinase inhibitor, clade A, member 1 isoform X1 [Xenopus tropicalis]
MRGLPYILFFITCIFASHNDNSHQEHANGHAGGKIAQEALGSANIDFALNLYKHLVTKTQAEKESTQKNIVFSPLSILTAFSMLLLGAKSESHQQILSGLSLNQTQVPEEDMHEAFEHLLQVLNRPKSDLQVKIGNAVFVEDTLKILDSFVQEIEHHYHAEIFPSHFKNPAEAEKQINDFVNNKTEGRIQELVKDLSEATKLVVINFILFNAEWQNPFSSFFTHSRQFSVDENTTVEVQMMSKTDLYQFYKDEKIPCSVLQLPYKNNASMLIIVPELGKIHEVEEALSVETLKRWTSSAEKSFFELFLPKFSISSSLKLKDILTDMGMGIIFTDAADFSGISENSRLKLSKVVHKAVLNVAENGTEAAAASAVEGVLTSLMVQFVVDKPFITLICSQEPYSILFMSRVIDPTEK